MSDARSAILQRVRLALGAETRGPDLGATAIARDYRRAGALSHVSRADLFCERAGEYRADVRRVRPGGIAEVVASVCGEHGVGRILVPSGVPPAWHPSGVETVRDDALTPRELDALGGVLTGCTVAIAETGTIVLTAAPHEGRRALTLVPDLHVCVVEERQIVEVVPEAIAMLADIVARERRPVTLVSGPSATSDIELSRVEGVHGPRSLAVLVVS